MKHESKLEQTITFRYLHEFRNWLSEQSNYDIIEIKATGGMEDMLICVTYRTNSETSP